MTFRIDVWQTGASQRASLVYIAGPPDGQERVDRVRDASASEGGPRTGRAFGGHAYVSAEC